MMRPPSPLSPPNTADGLLKSLRSARLLSARRARALAGRWAAKPNRDGCEGRVRELLAAGLLTRYQAGQVLAGKAGRLRLGPCRILDRLGVGGMGQVYKAEHILMHRVVALKIVARLPRRAKGDRATPPPEGESSRRELIARFRREVRSAARMSHPNVVTAYDAGAARGFLYLVMEYVEGTDLGRFVAENGPLPVPLACEAVRQAALALQYAHDRGLVHRDIKPDNLLLTWPGAGDPPAVGSLPSLPDGTSGEGAALVKLLDLGLALPAQLPAGRVEPAGTPDYMAPEQAHPGGPLDGRSDLYSLGCTFYYLLTGRVPYPGGSWTEKLLRHGLERPRAVTDLRPEVPPTVAAVVERLMAKQPEERYPGPAVVASVLWGLAERGWGVVPQAAPRPAAPPADAGPCETPSVPSLPELPPVPPAQEAAPPEPVAAAVEEPVAAAVPVPSPAEPRPVVMVPPRRHRLPGRGAVVAAALAGPLLVVAARGLPTGGPRTQADAEPVTQAPTVRVPLPFRVDRLGREFATLTEAVAAAADGDTLTVSTVGPHRLPPTDFGGKSLTLRAAGGVRPRLEPHDPASCGPWQALLAASRPLTLIGFELASPCDAPLVAGTATSLLLTDCQLAAGGGPAVVARGGRLRLQSCRVRAAATALAVEADGGPCVVDLAGNSVGVADPAGVALAVWAPEVSRPADVLVNLEKNNVAAGRVASFRALPGRLRVRASGNEFTFRQALASFSGYATAAGWRRSTSWEGGDNRYHGAGSWLRVDGRPFAVSDADSWRRLWSPPPEAAPPREVSALPASLP
jgi:serine/threonine-protein kinase